MADGMNSKSQKDPIHKTSQSDLAGGSLVAFGLQFTIGIFLFLYLGKWIDSRLGTAPIGLILGVFIGAIGSFYLFYRRLTASQRADDELQNGNQPR
jgi:F0F1-type ATP synthase assembly protein I